MSRNERLKLVLYAGGIVLTAPLLAGLLDRAWAFGTPARRVVTEVTPAIGLPGGVDGILAVGCFGLGLYLTLLTLYANDVRKRIQGILLFVGVFLVLGVLAASGSFLANVDFTSRLNWGLFVTGIGLGLLIEYSTLSRVDLSKSKPGHARYKSGRSATFNYATAGLYVLTLAILGIGLGQVVLNNSFVIFDALAVVAFLILLYFFLGYRSNHQYQVLGPEQSGKSMFQLGLFLERTKQWQEQTVNVPPNPSPGMRDLISQLEDYNPETDGWPTTSNELQEMGLVQIWFEYIAGDKFPVHVVMGAIDHAGQHLKDIARKLQPDAANPIADGGRPQEPSATEDNKSRDLSDSIPLADEENESESSDINIVEEEEEDDVAVSMDEFFTRVKTADTLILLLDCERIKKPEDPDRFSDPSIHADEMDTIVQHTNNRTVFIVAAKADYYLDEFYMEYGFEGSPEEDSELFDAFRAFVTMRLQQEQMVETLMQDAQVDTIHPVYFKTQEIDGRRVPELDARGRLDGVGFEQILDHLEEEL